MIYTPGTNCIALRLELAAACLLLLAMAAAPAKGQVVGCPGINGGFRQVGGVTINADGVVAESSAAEKSVAVDELRARIGRPSAALEKPVGLRLVSLRGLAEACREAQAGGTPLPEEVRCLSGLQRIQFVFVFPDRKDIVLAGPGEGWRVDEEANIVGVTTGRPVLQLADLVVALRSVGSARDRSISCSIDPTAAGRRDFGEALGRQRQFSRAALVALEKAMGAQEITISGVPDDSHFAQVMVAADYRMKRLAMGFEASPVAGLPSYLELLKKRGKPESATPRWWLACNYEPLLRSEDGLAWELRGAGVKALTEDDAIDAAGGAKGSGEKSPLAQEWAERFTAKYDELSGHKPVFCELRNLMDLCVVAALLHKESLWDKSGCDASYLTSATNGFELAAWHSPRSVSTQCGFVKAGKEYIITASGGVQIEPFLVAGQSKVDGRVEQIRTKTPAVIKGQWWWQ